MNTIEISGMSQTEKLQTMETLWDSLTHDTAGIESPAWHQEILSTRKLKIEKGKAEYLSIEELRSK